VARTTGKKDPYKWREDDHDKSIPDYVRKRVILDSGDLCRCCGVRVRPGSGHVDHIVPLQDGGVGGHEWGNLQYLCSLCHCAKTSKENTTRAKGNRVFAKTYGIVKSKGRQSRRRAKPEAAKPTWYIGEDGRLRCCTLKPNRADDADK
jgi:hypothetical protein